MDAAHGAGGGRVVLTPGCTYRTSDTLTVPDNVRLEAHGATVERVAAVASGDDILTVPGDRVVVEGGTFRTASAPAEINNAYGIVVSGSDVRLEGVEVCDVAATGIVVEGANGRVDIIGNYVHDTRADGLRFARTVTDCTAQGNHFRNTGDDGISVVGVISNGARPTGISILGNTIEDTTDGRGIAVVGGQGVTVVGNTVRNADLSGILVAHDGSFGTYGARDVAVADNIVVNPNTDAGAFGGIVVAGGSPGTDERVANVSVTGNTVAGGNGPGVRASGATAGSIENLHLADNLISDCTNPTGQGIRASGVKHLTIHDNRILDVDEHGIYVLASCTGILSICHNAFTGLNRSAGGSVDGIHVEAATLADRIVILANVFAPGMTLNYAVECVAPGAIVNRLDTYPVNLNNATGGAWRLTAGSVALSAPLIGFYGAAPVARPSGVPVTAAGIHAALVAQGLIAP